MLGFYLRYLALIIMFMALMVWLAEWIDAVR